MLPRLLAALALGAASAALGGASRALDRLRSALAPPDPDGDWGPDAEEDADEAAPVVYPVTPEAAALRADLSRPPADYDRPPTEPLVGSVEWRAARGARP